MEIFSLNFYCSYSKFSLNVLIWISRLWKNSFFLSSSVCNKDCYSPSNIKTLSFSHHQDTFSLPSFWSSWTSSLSLTLSWQRSLSYRNRHERIKQFAKLLVLVLFCFGKIALFTPWTQNVNWTCIRHFEDVQDGFWASCLRSVYAMCPRGKRNLSVTLKNVFATLYQWLKWLRHVCIKQKISYGDHWWTIKFFSQSLCSSKKLNLCEVPAMLRKTFGSKLAFKQNLTGPENFDWMFLSCHVRVLE